MKVHGSCWYDEKVKLHLIKFLKRIPHVYRLVRMVYHLFYLVRNAFKSLLWLKSKRINRILKKHLSKHQTILNASSEQLVNKIVIICITRDENDLINLWIQHHKKLQNVCAVVIVDHLSIIPIEFEAIEQDTNMDFHIYRFSNGNYFAAHIVNEVAKRLSPRYSNVIFLPLDTDEFLSQNTIDKICKSSLLYGYLDWQMYWPLDACTSDHSNDIFLSTKKFVSSDIDYLGNKHFMRSSILKKGYLFGQAAHEVYTRFGFLKRGPKVGNMIHIPVRDFQQVYSKFSRGLNAHFDKALSTQDAGGENVYAKHWKVRSELLPNRENFVRDAILRYLPVGADINNQNTKDWNDLFI